ncbi:IclR family transcriptional regulator [Streptomyces sp. MNU89]|uniref:IclR family transcriptional regulator n=1 Tax=Streptomyces sp. MNU89 TaxID=2560025 RepID=UPI001E2C897A|nr:IclR family transcriptional regulator [Streptomyces sp. MNU89]MCC9738414.1 IclR family transcriptional regulator [Streptomyces sp. MNU89]
MSVPETTTLSTLERGLAVLEYICEHGPANAKRIARDLGLRQGTCYHILRTLAVSGHVARQPDGQYEPGPHAYWVARQIQKRVAVVPELSVILARLHNVTGGETSYITRWQDGAAILQHYLAGTQATNVGKLEVGFGGDLHARASSKAIIALLPGDQVEALFKGVKLAQLTPATITDYEELLVELAQIRRQGYAMDREEFAEGVQCVASGFVSPDGTPAGAYTVSVPTIRFAKLKPTLVAAVVEAAAMATRFLAGKRPVDAVTAGRHHPGQP